MIVWWVTLRVPLYRSPVGRGGKSLPLALQEAKGPLKRTPTENRVAPLFLGAIAAQTYAGADRLDEAESTIDDYEVLAREAGALHDEALALRVQGQVYTAQERPDEATQVLDTSIIKLERLESRLELGRIVWLTQTPVA